MVAGVVFNIISLKWPHKWNTKEDKSELRGDHKPVEITRTAKKTDEMAWFPAQYVDVQCPVGTRH